MLGDEDIAKFRGVISMLGWVETTEIVEDGDDNLEPRLVSLGDNVDDDNTFEIPVPSLIETLILFKVSFKDDEDEAASEVSSIFKFLLFNYIQVMILLISIIIIIYIFMFKSVLSSILNLLIFIIIWSKN